MYLYIIVLAMENRFVYITDSHSVEKQSCEYKRII